MDQLQQENAPLKLFLSQSIFPIKMNNISTLFEAKELLKNDAESNWKNK